MSISAIGCFFQKLQPTDSLIKPANIDSFTALHFRYHRFSTSHTSCTSHTGRVALPGAGGRGEVHSGRHSSWHDAVPPDCPVELISLMKAGVFFQKAKVLRWKLSFKQWMKYDEIVWNDMLCLLKHSQKWWGARPVGPKIPWNGLPSLKSCDKSKPCTARERSKLSQISTFRCRLIGSSGVSWRVEVSFLIICFVCFLQKFHIGCRSLGTNLGNHLCLIQGQCFCLKITMCKDFWNGWSLVKFTGRV